MAKLKVYNQVLWSKEILKQKGKILVCQMLPHFKQKKTILFKSKKTTQKELYL